MNIRKQDSDVQVVKQIAQDEARKQIKRAKAGITGRRSLSFLRSYTGKGEGGPRFGESYDGFQEYVRARAYGVSGATIGEATDVVREKLNGKEGIYLMDGFSATEIEIRYAPVNNALHVLLGM